MTVPTLIDLQYVTASTNELKLDIDCGSGSDRALLVFCAHRGVDVTNDSWTNRVIGATSFTNGEVLTNEIYPLQPSWNITFSAYGKTSIPEDTNTLQFGYAGTSGGLWVLFGLSFSDAQGVGSNDDGAQAFYREINITSASTNITGTNNNYAVGIAFNREVNNGLITLTGTPTPTELTNLTLGFNTNFFFSVGGVTSTNSGVTMTGTWTDTDHGGLFLTEIVGVVPPPATNVSLVGIA